MNLPMGPEAKTQLTGTQLRAFTTGLHHGSPVRFVLDGKNLQFVSAEIVQAHAPDQEDNDTEKPIGPPVLIVQLKENK